jgi:hypothetical protein
VTVRGQLLRISKGEALIQTIEDWKRLAPPKAAAHWEEGRSACELARAWCGTGSTRIPAEVLEILASKAETQGVVLTRGEPECRIRFDQLGGEPRNADLSIEAIRHGEPVAITIEAKADEPYGEFVSDALAASIERALVGGHSNGGIRIEQLARALLPVHRRGLPGLGGLRYQLLTAAAGTLVFAHNTKASVAVLLVHEFMTDKTKDARHDANHRDLEAFVTRLSDGKVDSVQEGALSGPFSVPGEPLFRKPADLFIGKIRTNIRTNRD